GEVEIDEEPAEIEMDGGNEKEEADNSDELDLDEFKRRIGITLGFEDNLIAEFATFDDQCTVEQWQRGLWTESKNTFREYPAGVRVLRFLSRGRDLQLGKDWNGSKMAKASVVVH